MKILKQRTGQLSPAQQLGFTAFGLALALSVYRPVWAVVPLIFFVGVCLSTPFFPAWGFFLPVYSRGCTGKLMVALTFDDGPDPETTPPLLELLGRYDVKATFFVTGDRAACHGDLIDAILERGHTLGNHSFSHDVWLMCRSSGRLAREIDATQCTLRSHGIVPLAFRPPVGITNPKLGPVLRERDLVCVNFSCRANDFGNRRVRGMAKRMLRKVRGDDILILHDVCPKDGTTVGSWISEVASVLSGLALQGLQVVSLAELLARPIMIKTEEVG